MEYQFSQELIDNINDFCKRTKTNSANIYDVIQAKKCLEVEKEIKSEFLYSKTLNKTTLFPLN